MNARTHTTRISAETLASYREVTKLGPHLGIGGKALTELLDEIDRLRAFEAQEKAKRVVTDEANGRWVGNKLYWDIGGESISDDDFKLWIRQNMPESWDRHPYVVAWHTIAFAYRRTAFAEFMKSVDFSRSYEEAQKAKAHQTDELGSMEKSS